MTRSAWLWWALGTGLVLAVLVWTIHTQPTPLLPVLEVLAWSGVLRWWVRQHRALHPRPTRVSLWFGWLLVGGVLAALSLPRPTSLAYGLPVTVGLAMALLALPLGELRRAAMPLLLLTIPLLPLLLRWVLPEPVLARATATTSAVLLQLLGLDALAIGHHLVLGNGGVRVAGACGGTEDIAFLLAFALLLAITQPPLAGPRVGMLLLIAPALGFLINAMRVALLAVVVQQGGWWKQEIFPSLHEGHGALVFSLFAVAVLVWLDGLAHPLWAGSLNDSSTA